jgi:diguanylate cyclase (GGDEF)-like protein
MRPDQILIVEDDPNIRTILKLQLEGAKYEVLAAEDGRIALEILATSSPDLILLDVMMPNMDGFTTCHHIRSDRRHAHVPIIFLTAKSESQSRIIGLEEGANDYIAKPYDREELLLRVQNLIAWGRAQRHSNPLTGLPGNPSIEAELNGRLGNGAEFAFLYVDLDNFKAFNDYYSYMAGDGVIMLIAKILQEVVAERGGPGDFVGHVGGDDFVVISVPERAGTIADEVVARFDTQILNHYRPEDRERGTVVVANRQGDSEEFPLVSVTIALVESGRHDIQHMAKLNDLVAELKHVGKQHKGSVVVRDRRRPEPQLRTGSDG